VKSVCIQRFNPFTKTDLTFRQQANELRGSLEAIFISREIKVEPHLRALMEKAATNGTTTAV